MWPGHPRRSRSRPTRACARAEHAHGPQAHPASGADGRAEFRPERARPGRPSSGEAEPRSNDSCDGEGRPREASGGGTSGAWRGSTAKRSIATISPFVPSTSRSTKRRSPPPARPSTSAPRGSRDPRPGRARSVLAGANRWPPPECRSRARVKPRSSFGATRHRRRDGPSPRSGQHPSIHVRSASYEPRGTGGRRTARRALAFCSAAAPKPPSTSSTQRARHPDLEQTRTFPN